MVMLETVMTKDLGEQIGDLSKNPAIPEKFRLKLRHFKEVRSTDYLTLLVVLDDLELDLLTSSSLDSKRYLASVSKVKKAVCDEGVLAYTNSVGHHLIHSLGVLIGGNPFDRTNHLEEARSYLGKARRLASYYPGQYREIILEKTRSLDRFESGIREVLSRQV